ncbi:hypothetical protein DL96DRAFT_1818842 [Flagelloscypha sp. PMI_526]|nr:hypothetical protein DL96DRAFT_1818842 [Flagelloscypha sp. PMI_526]
MIDPAYASHQRCLGLPLLLVEECSNTVSSDDTSEAFLRRLDFLVDVKCPPSLLESLKVHVQHVSEDLAAISFSSDISTVNQQNVTRFFWAFILAITLVNKNRKSVFECLIAILVKVHGTTRLLRHPMPGVDDITTVDKLKTAIILLLCCAIPRRFLLVFRRSIHPDKILYDSQVKSYLGDLSQCVRSVQGL